MAKTCTRCNEEKALDGFARCSSSKDGRQPRCRPCQTALSREWNAANPERRREIDRARYARSAERRRDAMRLIRDRDRDAYRVKAREWNITSKHKRRARVAAAIGRSTREQRRQLLDSYLGRCAYCFAPATTFDHVDALSRGGSNGIENLVPACRPCNNSKATRTLLGFLTHKTVLSGH